MLADAKKEDNDMTREFSEDLAWLEITAWGDQCH